MVRGSWGLLMGVIALMTLTLLVIPTLLNARYFPPDFPRAGFGVCEDSETLDPSEDLQWFGPLWRESGERPLYQVSQQLGGRTIYRFSRFPSQGLWSVILRLDENEDGSFNLHAKRTRRISSGGHLRTEHYQRRLSPGEQERVESLLAAARLGELQPGGCNQGLDGSRWIVETVKGGEYLYINRHSPEDGPVREIGEAFLELTGWPPFNTLDRSLHPVDDLPRDGGEQHLALQPPSVER